MGCLPFNSLGGQSDISIHTSVKEAAGNVPGKGSPPYIFQSMPPRRRRPIWRWIPMQSSRFQSTPPRRRRPGCVFVNSLLQISIHASAKEATSDEELYEVFGIISIHASAKEATVTVNDGLLLQKFQSTPPRRRRQCDPPHYDMDTVFQSTPPRRRRPQHIVIPQLSCTYLVSTTFLSTIFSFISQYVVLFFLF